MGIQSFKKITGAALVAGGLSLAGSVQAAISDDNFNAGPLAGNGSGELFLSVLDPAGQRSLVYDLGITVANYRANAASYVGTLFNNATLLNFISTTADQSTLRWNMAGLSNMPIVEDPVNFDDFGYVQSGKDVNPSTVAPGWAQMNDAMSNARYYLLAQNGAGNTNWAQNDIEVVTNPLNPAYYVGSGQWGADFGAKTAKAEMMFGETTNLYFVTMDPADLTLNTARVETLVGQWRLSAAGLEMTPVPVPAGIWLMGSALAGLGGMLRKVRERAATAKS